MPLIRNIVEPEFRYSIWHVTESYDELLAMLPNEVRSLCLKEAEQRFTSDKRRMEFIAVRVLLAQMIPSPLQIAYQESGKPYLVGSSLHLSISHTADVVAVILSENEVGIDVERYSERVCRVASRFINEQEKADSVWEKLILWSAKETIYKMMNCREVDFCRHICSLPIHTDAVFQTGTKGSFVMQTHHPAHQRSYAVIFELFENFVLTYSVDHSK